VAAFRPGRLTGDQSTRQGRTCARLSVITQVGLASTSPSISCAHSSGEKGAAGFFDSTSAITVNRRATVDISRRFSASSIPAAPFDTSTYGNLVSEHQARYSSARPCSHSASTSPARAGLDAVLIQDGKLLSQVRLQVCGPPRPIFQMPTSG
jgi:hypothetical protein